MHIKSHEAGQIDESRLEFVVICVKRKEKWVLVRHKDRSTWEMAGGHIDNGESALCAALRELYEETGIIKKDIDVICDYEVIDGSCSSFGRLFYTTVEELCELPGYEIAEARFFDRFPPNSTYPDIYNALIPYIGLYEINRNGSLSDGMKNVRLFGDKPYKAVVVHGGPGALGTVAAIARELSGNFGALELLQTQNSISGLLKELDEVIRVNCDGPITLIGHSWGAWLVFIYAAKYPQCVKKVILVGSGPFEAKYVSEISYNRMKHLPDFEREEFDELLKQLDSDMNKEKDILVKRMGELVNKCDNYSPFEIDTDKEDCFPVEGDRYSAIWREAAALRESGELSSLADKISCPVVAIHGEYDPHPVDGVKLTLENRIKDFKFYTLEKCGHSPWKERYAFQEFYKILREELEG